MTGQRAAIVSAVPGTTTDPVYRAMELQPLGPVVFVDTAGVDDDGVLGKLRTARTQASLAGADVVVLVVDGSVGWGPWEDEICRQAAARSLALVVAWNKADLLPHESRLPPVLPGDPPIVPVSAMTGQGVEELRRALIQTAPEDWAGPPILADLLVPGDTVVLVTPQDSEAPRGRLILPQVQTLREILDAGAMACLVKEDSLETALGQLCRQPRLVVTDSQAFRETDRITPKGIPLTSFSVLFARHRGNIAQLVEGAARVDHLRPGDEILVAEACTHHPIGDDIGRVKIPRLLQERVGGDLSFTWQVGTDLPEDLAGFRLVVHCGGCMLGRREMLARLERLRAAGVPVVNYGVLIASLLGILDRALGPIPGAAEAWERVKAGGRPCRTPPA